MKVLRFNDDQIGILKGEDHVVDISGIISYRAEKGPQRVIQEVIEKFDVFRDEIERIVETKNPDEVPALLLQVIQRRLLRVQRT